jgi:hypothetical protein
MLKKNRLILEAFEDASTGVLGLGLADMPRNDDTNAASDGLLLAHDIVEHVNGPEAIGTIADELEALGAIWYVRGQHGELRRDLLGSSYTVEQNIAADVTRMFRDFFYGAPLVTKPPRTRPTDADDAFRAIIAFAVHDAPGEVNDGDTHTPRQIAARLRAYTRVCLPLMRTGYRKAERKYERHGRFFANNLFWAIERATDRYCKNPEGEGFQYALDYGYDNQGRAYARCEEFYGDDIDAEGDDE